MWIVMNWCFFYRQRSAQERGGVSMVDHGVHSRGAGWVGLIIARSSNRRVGDGIEVGIGVGRGVGRGVGWNKGWSRGSINVKTRGFRIRCSDINIPEVDLSF